MPLHFISLHSMSEERRLKFLLNEKSTERLLEQFKRLTEQVPNSPLIPLIHQILNERGAL